MVNRMLIIPEYNPQLADSDEEELDKKSFSGKHGPTISNITNTVLPSINSNTATAIVSSSGSVPTTPTFITSSSSVISYRGRVCTVYDALLLFEATKLDLIPTINRRLLSTEKKKYIRPNTVFIWNETKCGMKRWTDGKIWSPSKVHYGQFLIYKQLAKDGTDELLVKQSFSLTTKSNQKLHLICYYQYSKLKETKRRKRDPDLLDDEFRNVNIPSNDERLKNIRLSDDYPDNLLPKDQNHLHNDLKALQHSNQPHSRHRIHQPEPHQAIQVSRGQPLIHDRHQTPYAIRETFENGIIPQFSPTNTDRKINDHSLTASNPYLSLTLGMSKHIEVSGPLIHYQNSASEVPLYSQDQPYSFAPSLQNPQCDSFPSSHYGDVHQESKLEKFTVTGHSDPNDRSSEAIRLQGSNYPVSFRKATPSAHAPYQIHEASREVPIQASHPHRPPNFLHMSSRNAPQLPQLPSHPFVHRSTYNYSDTHTLDVLDKVFSSAI